MFAYVDQIGAVVLESGEDKRIAACNEAVGLECGRNMKVVNAPVVQEEIEMLKSMQFFLSGFLWQLKADRGDTAGGNE